MTKKGKGLKNVQKNKCVPFIDWLSFTIKNYSEGTILYWIAFLGGESRNKEKGYLNYNKAIETNYNGLIAWNSENKELGLYISLSAKALKNLSDSNIDSYKLAKKALEYNAKFTRIDLTIDDFEGYLDLDLILDKIKKDEIRTKLKSFSVFSGEIKTEISCIESGTIGSENTGKTIYIGNMRKSDAFIRIYDKKAQTKTEKFLIWNRVELVLKHENANQFINNHYRVDSKTGELKKKGDIAIKIKSFEERNIPDLIYYYLDFLEIKKKKNGSTTHKRHWQTCQFWLDFLNTEIKEKIGLPKYESGLEELKEWSIRSISTLDFTLAEIYGNDYLEAKKEKAIENLQKNKKYSNWIKENEIKKQ